MTLSKTKPEIPHGPTLQTAPLRVNAVGALLLPLQLAINPSSAVPPEAIFAFHPASCVTTLEPVWVNGPFHSCVIVCPFGNVQARVHPLIAGPRLVIFTSAWKPVFHWLTIV